MAILLLDNNLKGNIINYVDTKEKGFLVRK